VRVQTEESSEHVRVVTPRQGSGQDR